MASPLCGESSDREMGERDAKVSELFTRPPKPTV